MNEVIKTIFERRAVRKYKDQPLSRDLIEQLLDAGRMAPSAINHQPWKFYVLTKKEDIVLFSKEILKEGLKTIPEMHLKDVGKAIISGIMHLAHGIDFIRSKDPVFHNAPVVIFITGPKDNEWAALDIGMCSQNIMLAARSMGLDTCPIGFGKFVEKTKDYPKLKIPSNEQVHLAISVGHGDQHPDLHHRKKDNVVYL
ncbi:MAG: nitroreductase [bacterium]|nr:nitroreductase [bacterium]